MLQWNKIFVAGNIVAEPEMRNTGTGVPVVNFRLACNTKLSADNTKVLFIDVSAFGKTAEAVQAYCGKGSNILVEGRLDEDQWTGDGGENRFKHFITAMSVKFISVDREQQEKTEDNTI